MNGFRSIGEVLEDMDWSSRLRELARRVAKNIPDHQRPEEFHLEKSEIVYQLTQLAGEPK